MEPSGCKEMPTRHFGWLLPWCEWKIRTTMTPAKDVEQPASQKEWNGNRHKMKIQFVILLFKQKRCE